MNAQTAKITQGRWHVVDGGLHWNNPAITNFRIHAASSKEGFDVAWSKDGELVVEHVYEREDAELIAEAGNVAQETGLMPRQLADQRAELLEALKELIADADLSGVTAHYKGRGFDESIEKARAAIAKATGEQP